MEGWIKLYRKITEWEWYTEPLTFRLFIHFLLMANHCDKTWRGIEIKRGQFLTSYEMLSQETKLTIQEIRTRIKWLISTGEITKHSSSEYTVISINNYDQYQTDNIPPNKQVTNKQQTSNKQVTTTKNVKNVKNDKNIIYDHFLEFWELYPKKIGKAKCETKYKTLNNKHEQIMAGLKKYIEFWQQEGTEMQFIPHPYTWLNGRRWEDDLSIKQLERKPRTVVFN